MSDDAEDKRILAFPVPWAEQALPAPNICLRSALFGVSKAGRRTLRDEILASVDGYSVAYTGERLDQFDQDVWLNALRSCRDFGLGKTVPITLRGLAKACGIGGGGKDVARVRRALDRMLEGTVSLEWPTGGFRGHLVSSFRWVKETEEYVIRLDPDLVGLFARDQFTLIDAAERMALASYLSKWLHGFIKSHQAVFPYKVATLRRLCGSETKDLKHFRADLRSALVELERREVINAWEIDGRDLVHIGRSGSRPKAVQIPAGLDRPSPQSAGSDRPTRRRKSPAQGAGPDRPEAAGPDRPETNDRGLSPTKPRVLADQSAGSDRPTLTKASEPESKRAVSIWNSVFGLFRVRK